VVSKKSLNVSLIIFTSGYAKLYGGVKMYLLKALFTHYRHPDDQAVIMFSPHSID